MYFISNNPSLINVPAHTSTRWDSGKQLDAGTLQILQNNVSTYQSQNNRTLASQIGGISNVFYKSATEAEKRGFNQTSYPTPSDFATALTHQQLAWGSDVAMKFGPFYIPTKATGWERPEYFPINVTFEISGSTTSKVYVAINGGNNPYENAPYAISTQNFTAGETFYKFSFTDIKEKAPSEENIIWMDFAAGETITEILTPIYVWVGIYRNNNTVNFKTLTISEPRLQP